VGQRLQAQVYRNALDRNRRPKTKVEVEVDLGDGIVLRGMPDLVFTEAVVEVKTNLRVGNAPGSFAVPPPDANWYVYDALGRAGQLLYANFHREWSFDLPQLPDTWEPWVREVAVLFRDHPNGRAAVPDRAPLLRFVPVLGRLPDRRADADGPGTDRPGAADRGAIPGGAGGSLARRETRGGGEGGAPGSSRDVGGRRHRTDEVAPAGRVVTIKTRTEERVDYSALDEKIKLRFAQADQ